MIPLSKWKCVVKFSSPAFCLQRCNAFLCRDDDALQCDAVAINDVRGREEERKQVQEMEKTSPRKKENGRVYSTKFIIGQKEKAKTHTHRHTCACRPPSEGKGNPQGPRKDQFCRRQFSCSRSFFFRSPRFSPVESGEEKESAMSEGVGSGMCK